MMEYLGDVTFVILSGDLRTKDSQVGRCLDNIDYILITNFCTLIIIYS